jgi:uncharacterized protein
MTYLRLETEELAGQECRRILRENRFGRLAFTFRDRVDIRPLSYVTEGDWIFGRTSAGEKILTLEHHRWVAFQVDRIEDPLNWESVVVHGAFHLLDEPGTGERERLADQARALIRRAQPGAFSPEDPAAERDRLFGIAIQEITGRRGRAVSSGG